MWGQGLVQIIRLVFEMLINLYGNLVDLMIVNRVYLFIRNEVDVIFLIFLDISILLEVLSFIDRLFGVDIEMVFGGDEVVDEVKQLLFDENMNKLGLWVLGGIGKMFVVQ